MTLDDVKGYIGLDLSDEDEDLLLNLLILSVAEQMDGANSIIGRSLAAQTLEKHLDGFPCDSGTISLQNPPVTSIAEFKYDNEEGTETDLPPTDYRHFIDLGRSYLVPASEKTWPATEEGKPACVRIKYIAGGMGIPNPVKVASLMMVQNLYDHRDVVDLTRGAINGEPSKIASMVSTNARENPVIYRLLSPYTLKRRVV